MRYVSHIFRGELLGHHVDDHVAVLADVAPALRGEPGRDGVAHLVERLPHLIQKD